MTETANPSGIGPIADALLQLTSALAGSASLEQKLNGLCESARGILGCDRVRIFLPDEQLYRARYAGAAPDRGLHSEAAWVQRDDPRIAAAVKSGRWLIDDPASRPIAASGASEIATPGASEIATSVVLAPMLDADGSPIGFASAERDPSRGSFGDESGRLLLSLARLAAVELERARRVEVDVALAAARAELSRLERTSVPGPIAEGVAHDLNNLLATVVGTCELALERAPRREAADFRAIAEAVDRAGELSRRLFRFARGGVGEAPSELLELGALLLSSKPLLEGGLFGRITLQLDIAPGSHWVRGSWLEIEQAILNLVLNARDAILGAGEITLSVRTEQHNAAENGPERSFTAVRVSDSGQGIRAEHLPRIFERFFTTKAAAEGSGLGLTSVKSLAQRLQGEIEVESEVGVGSSFTLWLPSARYEAEPDLSQPA